MIGLQAGTLLGGSVVIESVFAIPGLGALSYEAVSQRDMPLLAGILLHGESCRHQQIEQGLASTHLCRDNSLMPVR